MGKVRAREVFAVSASDSERTDQKQVYPSGVEFDRWRDAVTAMKRVLTLGFVAIVSREVVEGAPGPDDADLDGWPAERHVVSTDEYWRRYAADHPEFRRHVQETRK